MIRVSSNRTVLTVSLSDENQDVKKSFHFISIKCIIVSGKVVGIVVFRKIHGVHSRDQETDQRATHQLEIFLNNPLHMVIKKFLNIICSEQVKLNQDLQVFLLFKVTLKWFILKFKLLRFFKCPVEMWHVYLQTCRQIHFRFLVSRGSRFLTTPSHVFLNVQGCTAMELNQLLEPPAWRPTTICAWAC